MARYGTECAAAAAPPRAQSPEEEGECLRYQARNLAIMDCVHSPHCLPRCPAATGAAPAPPPDPARGLAPPGGELVPVRPAAMVVVGDFLLGVAASAAALGAMKRKGVVRVNFSAVSSEQGRKALELYVWSGERMAAVVEGAVDAVKKSTSPK